MFLGLVEMTFGLVYSIFSLPEWQALKMTVFAPCLGNGSRSHLRSSGHTAELELCASVLKLVLLKKMASLIERISQSLTPHVLPNQLTAFGSPRKDPL